MKTTEEYLDDVKKFVSEKLDWNLSHAEIVSYRVTADWRMQVTIIDRCPMGAELTREYLECLKDRAHRNRIDLTIRHTKA